MSADFDHYVSMQSLNGTRTRYRAGSHRVQGGALVLVGDVEQMGAGYAGPDGNADEIIIPLGSIVLAVVDIRERPER